MLCEEGQSISLINITENQYRLLWLKAVAASGIFIRMSACRTEEPEMLSGRMLPICL